MLQSRNGVSLPGYEPDALRHASPVLLAIHGHGYVQHYYQVYHLRPKSTVTTTTHVATDTVPSHGTIYRPIGRYIGVNPRYQSWQPLHLGHYRPLLPADQMRRLTTYNGNLRGISHYRRMGRLLWPT